MLILTDKNIVQALLSTVALDPDEAAEIIAKSLYSKISDYMKVDEIEVEIVDYKFLMLKLGWKSTKCSELMKKLREQFANEFPEEFEKMKYWQGERKVIPMWFYKEKFDWLENKKATGGNQ